MKPQNKCGLCKLPRFTSFVCGVFSGLVSKHREKQKRYIYN